MKNKVTTFHDVQTIGDLRKVLEEVSASDHADIRATVSFIGRVQTLRVIEKVADA